MINLIEYAETEFRRAGYLPPEQTEGRDKWVQENVIELLRVFMKQMHSGIGYQQCIEYFSQLANFNPIIPLTTDSSEWKSVGNGILQNKYCFTLLKIAGEYVYFDAISWEDQEGAVFTGDIYLDTGEKISGRQIVKTFPFIPKNFCIRVHRISRDVYQIQDDEQLKKALNYYKQK